MVTGSTVFRLEFESSERGLKTLQVSEVVAQRKNHRSIDEPGSLLQSVWLVRDRCHEPMVSSSCKLHERQTESDVAGSGQQRVIIQKCFLRHSVGQATDLKCEGKVCLPNRNRGRCIARYHPSCTGMKRHQVKKVTPFA